MNDAAQVQQVRRRLVQASAAPMVKRLQLLTVQKPPREWELLDALMLAAAAPTDVDPVERVLRCWQRWCLVMCGHESFSAYARRNMRRPL